MEATSQFCKKKKMDSQVAKNSKGPGGHIDQECDGFPKRNKSPSSELKGLMSFYNLLNTGRRSQSLLLSRAHRGLEFVESVHFSPPLLSCLSAPF